jgi:FHS family glucose/mannose:H+ symporter-like MFS transporter
MTRVESSSFVGRKKISRFEWFLLHAGFVATGVVTTILGPILPLLAARWSLNDRQAGLLFTAQFLSSLVGALATGYLVPRRGFVFVIRVGFAFMAGGVGLLGFGPWMAGLLAMSCVGMGMGLTIPATNLYVSHIAGDRPAGALSIINFAWGIGSVACPFLVIFFESRGGVRGLGGFLAIILFSFAVGFGFVAEEVGTSAAPLASRVLGSGWKELLGSGPAWALAAFFFLYVGTEVAVGGWIAAVAKRVYLMPDALWVLTPSAFWGGLLLGRAVAPGVLRHLEESRLVYAGLSIAVLGTAVVLLASSRWGIRMGGGLAGFGLAPIYPVLVSWLSRAGGINIERSGGLFFACAGCGGAVLPWLVGALSARTGSLHLALSCTLASSVLMLLLIRGARPQIGTVLPK